MNDHCREYQKADIVPLKELIFELGYDVSLPELQKNIHEIYRKGGTIFVYDKDRQVLGSVCVVEDVRLAEGIYCEIVSLVVSENVRGQGVGRALVECAADWAKKRSGKIRVRANIVRTAAHEFYEKQRFIETKSQKVFIRKL